MSNPFEDLANAQMVAATKAKHRAAEKRSQRPKLVKSERDAPMKLSEQEQAMADRQKLMANYRRVSKQEFKALIGENGPNWWSLGHKLDTLTLDGAHQLADFVADPNCWLHAADLRSRQIALSLIAARLIVLRLEDGRAPMDDSIPGEEPTIFEIIRNELKVLT